MTHQAGAWRYYPWKHVLSSIRNQNCGHRQASLPTQYERLAMLIREDISAQFSRGLPGTAGNQRRRLNKGFARTNVGLLPRLTRSQNRARWKAALRITRGDKIKLVCGERRKSVRLPPERHYMGLARDVKPGDMIFFA